EIMIRVLAEVADALALLHAAGDERVRHLVGVGVVRLEGRVATLEGEGDGVGLTLGKMRRDVGDCLPVGFGHRYSILKSLSAVLPTMACAVAISFTLSNTAWIELRV